MSTLTAGTGYGGQLWLDHEIQRESFTFAWDKHAVNFSIGGYRLETEFELAENEQEQLVEALTKEDPSLPPHWQALPPELHRTVEKMADQIQEAAVAADACIRRLPKALRLQPVALRPVRTQAGQEFSVVHWRFSDEEREKLRPLFEAKGTKAANVYKNGITIPMPVHFERRQVHLTEDEVNKVGEFLTGEIETLPFTKLYAIALDNFVSRSYDSAVLILATSIETALKWWLIDKGDGISEYLITNTQSPPIDKLYSCARRHTKVAFPKSYSAWLVNLRNARNNIAHKPQSAIIKPLEAARWFAVGEAIIGAMLGREIEPMAGMKVEPIGERVVENFPEDSKGVVLRREVLYGENSFHIVLDTGETCRFGESAFKKCDEQEF